MELMEMQGRIMNKMAARRFSPFGLFDWSHGSWEWQVAFARAYRVQQRLMGRRISFKQAMWG